MKRLFILSTLRGIKNNPLYSFINISSLSISMAVSLLLLMLLSEQLDYDRFHADANRIYRIISGRSFSFNQNATVPIPLAEQLKEYHNDMEIARIVRSVGGDVDYEDKSVQLAGYFATPSFFDVFGYELISGNAATALIETNSVVLTTTASEAIFGNIDPIGKIITINDRGISPSDFETKKNKPVRYGDFIVTGVLRDPPGKSHLVFDMLVSEKTIYALQNQGIKDFPLSDWDNYYTCYTYIKAPENFDDASFEQYLNQLSDAEYQKDEFYRLQFELQPMNDITPGKLLSYAPTLRMPKTLYYIFAALVAFICMIAAFNYTNISIARSMVRAKEIGIRKVSGASRLNLVGQFLTESVTTAVISAIIAILLLVAIRPAFMQLNINQYLNYDLQENLHFIALAILLVMVIGLLTGFIPSLYLSRLKPTSILKSTLFFKDGSIPAGKKVSVYKAIVSLQFFFSFIFIVSTLLLIKQSRHYLHLDPGFDKQNILVMDLQGHEYDKVAPLFHNYSSIAGVAGSDALLGVGSGGTSYMITMSDDEDQVIGFPGINISKEFLALYKVDLVAGVGFESGENEHDVHNVLINLKGVKRLGLENAEDAIGLTLNINHGEDYVKIIGVTNDFQSEIALAESEHLLMRCEPEKFQYLSLRLPDQLNEETKKLIESTWKQVDPVHAADYELLSTKMNASIMIFSDISSIIAFVTSISICLSCFGLLGITAFITERRIKEIGIRKVMGASVIQIHRLLSQGFIKLILFSSFIAAPFAFFLNGMWLRQLANKVSFGGTTLLAGSIILLVIGILTISIQVFKLSLINPVNILNEE